MSGFNRNALFYSSNGRAILLSILLIAISCFFAGGIGAQAPSIFSISPARGPAGTLIKVNGTNLTGPTAFTVGGTTALVISNTGSQLVGLVMPGSVSGPVSVSTAAGSASSVNNFTVLTSRYPSLQQGNKLVGTGADTSAFQGTSVALSADGNTAISGGSNDNNSTGAAWVYIRVAGFWGQQGVKLVGVDTVGISSQGESVAISADGNTALVGGVDDNNGIGAVWVFTRPGGMWMQQGTKLVGSGATSLANQGSSVSISADGNTAIVGADGDSSNVGAAWIFTRNAGVWTQQGTKLVGTGAAGEAWQGTSVALSADGKTAMVGGSGDNQQAGAVWVYTLSGGVWTQVGTKLVAAGATGPAYLGESVALSADGLTAVVGGDGDNSNSGAAWIFTSSGGVWTQEGSKLVGAGAVGSAWQGVSVSLSADGNTALVGGKNDDTEAGAAWVYTRAAGVWTQQGNKLVGTGALDPAYQGQSVSLAASGSTALIGGFNDNNGRGATWVFDTVFAEGIQEYGRAELFNVYPNPSSGTLTIQADHDGVYSILNDLGQTIRQFTLKASENYSFHLEGLTEGMYFIVGLNNNRMSSQKVVVLK